MIVLGIETSCDETAVSICKDGEILSNIISSQTVHSEFGGVVPEIASREHERLLNNIAIKAIKDASIKIDDIEGIAVTNGPGLAGSLLTGVSFAKGLALGLRVKIISINHLEAHIMANLLDKSNINFPFLCLLVSGGHTQVWSINKLDDYVLLGETRDDAAGEAFDKGARIMGLGYPGGPEIEECAIDGNPKLIKFPRALIKSNKIEFSFSGVKTSLLYFMDSFSESKKYSIADVAASYQQAIIDCLINKIELAIVQTGINIVTIAGGVAKNSVLRNQIKKTFPKNKIIFPDMNYCTDNAAMISFLGEIKFNLGSQSRLDFGIIPNFQLESN
ncbi:MAG: tRNA (adenosine(37)-N6)-threonylcarbamoyltransferase complex transferase subunit TsaD [Candidatus Neomarinimicrobiota bacterium]|jgi:N6-L-threonylcarbamoyladenine synthase|nr:tRNA (adenosine(37)-N6)-threonylcarbamoyltransferase complex transferase subunit TsaD [Candidatus Neomarinimicrobiota bacterium]|tara:strand:+ start:1173 stop:2168 length:996 start_codon:yes stop_codon:yes gene_type:complete